MEEMRWRRRSAWTDGEVEKEVNQVGAIAMSLVDSRDEPMIARS